MLGLATGNSAGKVYKELIEMYKNKEVSFKNVVTFNLKEYYPMSKESSQSQYHFMQQHLFQHIDINPENINIPDGECNF